MKRLGLIVFGVCCLISSVLGKTVVATVDSYQSATLSGDIWSADMKAIYYNDTKNGGRIGADKTATMTISGMPAGTIDGITLWMHSNINSGAGEVELKVGDESTIVATGDYKDWPGREGYATDFESIKIYNQCLSIFEGASVTIVIRGDKNSLYIKQMDVDYTPAPATPHNVTLSWVDKSLKRCERVLQEKGIKQGVPLVAVPDSCKSILNNGVSWRFIGWSENAKPKEYTRVYETSDRYYPQRDVTLYAVYSDDESDMRQDTTITGGEYMMALGDVNNILHVMYGRWNENQIQLKSIKVEDAKDGLYHYQTNAIPEDWRYTIDVQGDSLTIWHAASQTWIGYDLFSTKKKGSPIKSYWKWVKTAHGSICLYADQDNDVYLVLDGKNFGENPYVSIDKKFLRTDCVFWVFFPVENVPIEAQTNWTTFIEQTGWYSVKNEDVKAIKVWKNGQIYICKDNHLYTILGEIL
ncbi:MAG: hypothetical protein MJZ79_04830 [Paludibacteraceae bacterium]|nr:hypothetical protein [Paludibacteraceae bacterium]